MEYDQVDDWVELRAQVYGKDIQSISWDLTGASRAGCSAGTSTYALEFLWNGYAPTATTETVSLTVTFTDMTSEDQDFSFVIPAGTGGSCPGGGGGGSGGGGGGGHTSAVWPEVLTPDTVKSDADLIGGEGYGGPGSPYSIGTVSGVAYSSHTMPSYGPSLPSLNLTYSSMAAERQPIFVGRYEIDPSGSVPETVSARLKFDGSWGSSYYYDTSPSSDKHMAGNVLQISLQADAGSKATGRYAYEFEVTDNFTGSSSSSSTSGDISVINEESSTFGEGWTLDILDRLHPVTGGVIVNLGAGDSLWFADDGMGGYTTPAGDFSTLVKNMDNTYTRTFKDGTEQHFDSSGYLTEIEDRNSNLITFTYDGSNRLSTIEDSNNDLTTFSYAGSCGASNRVCTVKDPADRVTTFAYNASGHLTSIEDPEGNIATYTYDSSSGRMTSIKDAEENTTTLTYGTGDRVTSVTRPDTSTESITSLQLHSLCATSTCTSGSPGTAVLSAEAVSAYTDPRTNDWEFRHDWHGFGVVTQMTDPLGIGSEEDHMVVNHYDTDGLFTQRTDRLERNTQIEYDTSGNATKITWADGNDRQFTYNSNSQVTKITDELDNVTTYTYDSSGNLTQIKQADPDDGGSQTSPITTMTYDSQGRMTSLEDPNGNVTTYAYDAKDRVEKITYPDGDMISTNNPELEFAYDSAGNVTSSTDENDNTTTMTYDDIDRLETTKDALDNVTTLTYDGVGNLIVITQADPDGIGSEKSPVTTYTYDSMNRQEDITDPLGNRTTFTYDNSGNMAEVEDPLNRITTFSYNELHQQETQKSPLGNVTTFTYDTEGQLTKIEDPLNRVTTIAYNNRGWRETVVDAEGETTTYSYDAVGNIDGSDDSGGSVGYSYDNLYRPTVLEDQLTHKTTFTYDSNGNRTSVEDALGNMTTFTFDERNRLTKITEPDPDGGGAEVSAETEFTYDAVGNRTAVEDPLGNITTYAYTSVYQVDSIKQADPDDTGPLGNPITTFTYDNLGRLESLKDPVDNLTTWSYDAASQVETEKDPLGKVTTYAYDEAGQLTKIIDRKNQRREFLYDDDGHTTQEKWCTTPTGSCTTSRIFTYSYDSAGQLTEIDEPDSRYTFTYDDLGRMTGTSTLKSNMPTVRLSNTYDGVGRRTSVSDDLTTSGTISFTYDSANRMTVAAMTVGTTATAQATFGYDEDNKMTSISRQDGTGTQDKTLTTFTYDDAGRLTNITHTYDPIVGSDTTLATFAYSYNTESQITVADNSDGIFTYSHDDTGQLTDVDGPNPGSGLCSSNNCDETFDYDLNGNRTASTGYGNNQTYTVGAGNRISSDGIYDYTYDENGNTLTKIRISDSQKWEYAWDYRNRLTQVVEKDSGATVQQQTDYVYDAFNRRIIIEHDADGPGGADSISTKSVYDGIGIEANVLLDFSGDDSLKARYLHGNAIDFLLAKVGTDETVYYLSDVLGSSRDVVDSAGLSLNHREYSGFGQLVAETATGDRFAFAGREVSPGDGSQYHRARYLETSTGSWLSEDSISFHSGTTNLREYVHNTPLSLVDANGMFAQTPVLQDPWFNFSTQSGGTSDPVVQMEMSGFFGNHPMQMDYGDFHITFDNDMSKFATGMALDLSKEYKKWYKSPKRTQAKLDEIDQKWARKTAIEQLKKQVHTQAKKELTKMGLRYAKENPWQAGVAAGALLLGAHFYLDTVSGGVVSYSHSINKSFDYGDITFDIAAKIDLEMTKEYEFRVKKIQLEVDLEHKKKKFGMFDIYYDPYTNQVGASLGIDISF